MWMMVVLLYDMVKKIRNFLMVGDVMLFFFLILNWSKVWLFEMFDLGFVIVFNGWEM